MRAVAFFVFTVVCLAAQVTAARADIASKTYVDSIVGAITQQQADWNQQDTSAPDYIKNKPAIVAPDAVEYVANKTVQISDDSTDNQYPTARAVNTALSAKADTDDIRFDTIPTARPAGMPPAGRVYIWFD